MSIIIKNINISHNGQFIVDTMPPEGLVSINNDSNYTKNSKVKLTLEASDETTDIEKIKIRNVDNYDSSPVFGEFIEKQFNNEILWNLTDAEGAKKVEVNFIDFAGNESFLKLNSDIRKLFSIEEVINQTVINNSDLFLSSNNKVYRSRDQLVVNLIKEFNGQILDIVFNNNTLYVATEGSGILYGLLDNEFIELNKFSSKIKKMSSFNNKLYILLENGDFILFSNSSFEVNNEFSKVPKSMESSGNLLYFIFENSNTLTIFNGNEFKEINIFDANFNKEEILSSSSSSSSELQNMSTSSDSSSSSTINLSTSSLSRSFSSSSSSSNSSESSTDMSISSLSSESFSSEILSSDGLDSIESEKSIINKSSSDTSESSLSSTSSDSTEGDFCLCNFVSTSFYVNNFKINNLTEKIANNCKLYGRIIKTSKNIRVIIFNDEERTNSIGYSDSFDESFIGSIFDLNFNDQKISGEFKYSNFISDDIEDFDIFCEKEVDKDSTSSESFKSFSSSSTISSSESGDFLIGDGTKSDPYRINNYDDMLLINDYLDSHFIFINDIDASESSHENFIPIGLNDCFSGTINGNGHVINNLFINSNENNVGFISKTCDATIKRLGFDGGLINGNNNVGFIIGQMDGGVLEECCVSSEVEGNKAVGGLVGVAYNNAEINNSYSDSDIEAFDSIVGGLIGFRHTSAIIFNCYSNGFVNAPSEVGGLVGKKDFSLSEININNEISDSFEFIYEEAVQSFWDIDASGTIISADGDGKNSEQMTQKETYINWDFEELWQMNEGDSAPFLNIFVGSKTPPEIGSESSLEFSSSSSLSSLSSKSSVSGSSSTSSLEFSSSSSTSSSSTSSKSSISELSSTSSLEFSSSSSTSSTSSLEFSSSSSTSSLEFSSSSSTSSVSESSSSSSTSSLGFSSSSSKSSLEFSSSSSKSSVSESSSSSSSSSSIDAQFISIWDTEKSGTSSNSQITLPLESSGNYNFTVKWGDGTQDTITTWNQFETTHTYATSGVYIVTISGTIEGFRFNNSGDKDKILDIEQWGDLKLRNHGGYFYGCSNLDITATDTPDLSSVTNAKDFFRFCSSLVGNSSFSNWDVSSVTDMSNMFKDAIFFNQDISGWNVSSVTDMSNMFDEAINFNQDLSGWNVSSVTDMSNMFEGAINFNQDLSNWDISGVTSIGSSMEGMFDSSGLSTSNYNAILNINTGWPNKNPQNNINFSAVTTKYTAGGLAEAGRTDLINNHSWTIFDDGPI